MIVGLQQDAHEFLVKLLDSLIHTWSKKGIKPKNGKVCKHNECNDVSKIFKGTMVSSIKWMTCHSENKCTQPFYELNLDFERKLLDAEILEGTNQYNCSHWDNLSDAIKTWKIKMAPPILIINLNRFNRYGLKMKKEFDYPLVLDLSDHVTEVKKTKLVYELTALIIHEGRFSFKGHYFSFVKGFDNKWYKCDDAAIKQVEDNNEILTSCPYILFYSMRPASRKAYLNTDTWEHAQVEKPKKQPKVKAKSK